MYKPEVENHSDSHIESINGGCLLPGGPELSRQFQNLLNNTGDTDRKIYEEHVYNYSKPECSDTRSSVDMLDGSLDNQTESTITKNASEHFQNLHNIRISTPPQTFQNSHTIETDRLLRQPMIANDSHKITSMIGSSLSSLPSISDEFKQDTYSSTSGLEYDHTINPLGRLVAQFETSPWAWAPTTHSPLKLSDIEQQVNTPESIRRQRQQCVQLGYLRKSSSQIIDKNSKNGNGYCLARSIGQRLSGESLKSYHSTNDQSQVIYSTNQLDRINTSSCLSNIPHTSLKEFNQNHLNNQTSHHNKSHSLDNDAPLVDTRRLSFNSDKSPTMIQSPTQRGLQTQHTTILDKKPRATSLDPCLEKHQQQEQQQGYHDEQSICSTLSHVSAFNVTKRLSTPLYYPISKESNCSHHVEKEFTCYNHRHNTLLLHDVKQHQMVLTPQLQDQDLQQSLTLQNHLYLSIDKDKLEQETESLTYTYTDKLSTGSPFTDRTGETYVLHVPNITTNLSIHSHSSQLLHNQRHSTTTDDTTHCKIVSKHNPQITEGSLLTLGLKECMDYTLTHPVLKAKHHYITDDYNEKTIQHPSTSTDTPNQINRMTIDAPDSPYHNHKQTGHPLHLDSEYVSNDIRQYTQAHVLKESTLQTLHPIEHSTVEFLLPKRVLPANRLLQKEAYHSTTLMSSVKPNEATHHHTINKHLDIKKNDIVLTNQHSVPISIPHSADTMLHQTLQTRPFLHSTERHQLSHEKEQQLIHTDAYTETIEETVVSQTPTQLQHITPNPSDNGFIFKQNKDHQLLHTTQEKDHLLHYISEKSTNSVIHSTPVHSESFSTHYSVSYDDSKQTTSMTSLQSPISSDKGTERISKEVAKWRRLCRRASSIGQRQLTDQFVRHPKKTIHHRYHTTPIHQPHSHQNTSLYFEQSCSTDRLQHLSSDPHKTPIKTSQQLLVFDSQGKTPSSVSSTSIISTNEYNRLMRQQYPSGSSEKEGKGGGISSHHVSCSSSHLDHFNELGLSGEFGSRPSSHQDTMDYRSSSTLSCHLHQHQLDSVPEIVETSSTGRFIDKQTHNLNVLSESSEIDHSMNITDVGSSVQNDVSLSTLSFEPSQLSTQHHTPTTHLFESESIFEPTVCHVLTNELNNDTSHKIQQPPMDSSCWSFSHPDIQESTFTHPHLLTSSEEPMNVSFSDQTPYPILHPVNAKSLSSMYPSHLKQSTTHSNTFTQQPTTRLQQRPLATMSSSIQSIPLPHSEHMHEWDTCSKHETLSSFNCVQEYPQHYSITEMSIPSQHVSNDSSSHVTTTCHPNDVLEIKDQQSSPLCHPNVQPVLPTSTLMTSLHHSLHTHEEQRHIQLTTQHLSSLVDNALCLPIKKKRRHYRSTFIVKLMKHFTASHIPATHFRQRKHKLRLKEGRHPIISSVSPCVSEPTDHKIIPTDLSSIWVRLNARLKDYGLSKEGIPVLDQDIARVYSLSHTQEHQENSHRRLQHHITHHDVDQMTLLLSNMDIMQTIQLWDKTFDRLDIYKTYCAELHQFEGSHLRMFQQNDDLKKENFELKEKIDSFQRLLNDFKDSKSKKWGVEINCHQLEIEKAQLMKQYKDEKQQLRIVLGQKRRLDMTVSDLKHQVTRLLEKENRIRVKAKDAFDYFSRRGVCKTNGLPTRHLLQTQTQHLHTTEYKKGVVSSDKHHPILQQKNIPSRPTSFQESRFIKKGQFIAASTLNGKNRHYGVSDLIWEYETQLDELKEHNQQLLHTVNSLRKNKSSVPKTLCNELSDTPTTSTDQHQIQPDTYSSTLKDNFTVQDSAPSFDMTGTTVATTQCITATCPQFLPQENHFPQWMMTTFQEQLKITIEEKTKNEIRYEYEIKQLQDKLNQIQDNSITLLHPNLQEMPPNVGLSLITPTTCNINDTHSDSLVVSLSDNELKKDISGIHYFPETSSCELTHEDILKRCASIELQQQHDSSDSTFMIKRDRYLYQSGLHTKLNALNTTNEGVAMIGKCCRILGLADPYDLIDVINYFVKSFPRWISLERFVKRISKLTGVQSDQQRLDMERIILQWRETVLNMVHFMKLRQSIIMLLDIIFKYASLNSTHSDTGIMTSIQYAIKLYITEPSTTLHTLNEKELSHLLNTVKDHILQTTYTNTVLEDYQTPSPTRSQCIQDTCTIEKHKCPKLNLESTPHFYPTREHDMIYYFMKIFKIPELHLCEAAVDRLHVKIKEHIRFYRGVITILNLSLSTSPSEILKHIAMINNRVQKLNKNHCHDFFNPSNIHLKQFKYLLKVFREIQIRLSLPEPPKCYVTSLFFETGDNPTNDNDDDTILQSCSSKKGNDITNNHDSMGLLSASSSTSSNLSTSLASSNHEKDIIYYWKLWGKQCIFTIDLLARMVEQSKWGFHKKK